MSSDTEMGGWILLLNQLITTGERQWKYIFCIYNWMPSIYICGSVFFDTKENVWRKEASHFNLITF